MKRHCFSLLAFLVAFVPLSRADIDITDLYLQNAGFDDETHFDYRRSDNGNVSQEILSIYGWSKDIGVDYTVTGIYELGTAKTFNTYGKVPASGYDGASGGCLALSTGWDESLKYYQSITLPAGKYKLQSAFYNGSNTDKGYSLLGWLTDSGQAKLSSLSSFQLNAWTLDEVSFSLSSETAGRVQIGFKGVSNGSANSAKVVSDFVKLYLVGNNEELLSDIRSALNNTLSSAKTLYGKGDGEKAERLQTAIEKAQNILDNATSYSEIFKAKDALNQEIELYQWANSSLENPSDFTKFIINPNFEEGLNGWSQSGLKTQTNTSFSMKSGNTYVEKWVSAGSSAGNVQISQEISNDLPMGIYQLKVAAQNLQGGNGNQKGAWIFAGNDSLEVSEAKEYTLRFTLVESSFSIGFLTQNTTGNWVAVDNFRLYYSAAKIDDFKEEMARRTAIANALLTGRMNKSHRENLQATLKQAEAWLENPSEESLASLAEELRKATQSAQTSAAAYERLSSLIEEAKETRQEQGKGNDQLTAAIQKAEKDWNDESQTLADINASTKDLQTAILLYKTENAIGNIPTVVTDPRHARGATKAFGRASFSGDDIIERGFCWSTQSDPTILDQRSTLSYDNNGKIFVIEDLSPQTFYYIRPYAISSSYAVGYGESIKICTLPMGEIAWSYNNGGSADENARINDAVADAVDVWNNLTSIRGLRLSVSYGASTQTADCSYSGSMRVGPNASYQRTGTIQHEMCHAAGVGTTSRWYDDATYRENVSKGFWLGERTDQILQFLENDNEAHLKGDNTHFWPYGINGAHEDDGTRMLYYANALIIQALGEDFLPPVYGAFDSPAYTFIQEDNEYYYILPENGATNTPSLLHSNGNGTELKTSDWKTILNDHAFAWQIQFNPESQLYEFKNILTERALSNNNAQVQLSSKENFGLQLLGSRKKVENGTFNLKSYWVTFSDGTDHPNALTENWGNVSATRFDHQNSASAQRWIILSRREVKALAGDYTELQEEPVSASSLIVTRAQGGLNIETTHRGEWMTIHDIQGKTIMQFYMQAGLQMFQPLEPGFYIVNGKKGVALQK